MSARVLAPFGARTTDVVARRETGGYVVFTALDVEGPDPAPGQFYMLRADGWGSQADARSCLAPSRSPLPSERATACGSSSSSRPSAPGRQSWRRSSREPGSTITGPLGRPFAEPDDVNPGAPGAIMVGGGIGVAPIAILRRHLTERGIPGRTLLGFRDEAHSGGLELFGACQEVGLAFEDGHRGHQGYVTDLLQVALKGDDAAAAAVYACGPPAMLEAVRVICAERGAQAELAMEAPMACGYGACFGCAVPLAEGGYMRLCVDGPVVRADEIETALVAGSGHR